MSDSEMPDGVGEGSGTAGFGVYFRGGTILTSFWVSMMNIFILLN